MNAVNPEPPFEDQALIDTVAKVWSSYLELETIETMPPESAASPAVAVTAAIAFNGAWDGHLRISSPVGPAAEIAALLLAMDLTEVSEQDMADSLGELVNVIGGNIRGLLPQPNQLGLPIAAVGARGALRFPASKPSLTVAISWKGEPIEFCLLQAIPRRERVVAGN